MNERASEKDFQYTVIGLLWLIIARTERFEGPFGFFLTCGSTIMALCYFFMAARAAYCGWKSSHHD